MAENTNRISVAMGMDVSDLKAGLAEANKQIQLANSQFKAASSVMDDWTKSTEGLNAKIKQLDTVLDMQKKKLAGLQEEHAKVAAEQGENSEAARKLQVQINNQQAVVNKTEKEFKNYTETLKRAEAGEIDLNEVVLKAGKAVEKAGKQSKDAADDVDKLGEEAKDAGDGFTIAKGAIAGFIANGLTALVGAAKNAISSVFGLAESTREYRTELAKIQTTAKDAGVSTDYIKDKWHDLTAVLGDEGAVGEGLNNLLTAGFSGDKLDEVTKLLEGASIKWKDTLKFEGLSDSIQEIIGSKGLSISGSAVELFERLGVDIEVWKAKFAELGTEEERQNMILQTLADGGLADVADAYREQNADLIAANKANSEYADTTAEIGAKIEPITTKIRKGFNSILEKILELTSGADFEKIGTAIENGFKWAVDTGLPAIQKGFQWVLDNKDGLIAGILGIGTAFLAFKVVSLIQGVISAMKGMTVAQAALNLVMSMNPIGLIVAAIAGLIAAFVALWHNCEGFRNFFIGMWEGIKTAVGAVVEWIKENWQTMLLFLVNPLAGVFKYCYDHFEGFRVFVDNVVTSVKDFFTNLWQSISNGVSSAWSFISGIFSTVATWFNDNVIQPIWNFIYPIIHNIQVLITGTWEIIQILFSTVAEWFNANVIQPVSQFFTDLWNGISQAASDAWAKIKEVFSIVSSWFDENIIQPVSTFFSSMWNGLKNGAKNAWEGIKKTFSTVASFFGDIFSKAWTKVKNVFSTGGKIFDGIKEGIVSAFKKVVNAIIRGINKVVAIPFNAINSALSKIKNIEIAGISPFSGLISNISVPKIPELYRGGVLKKGQIGLLEGKAAEAVVPLERNLGWIKKIASQLADYLSLDVSGVKGSLAAVAHSGRGTTGGVGGVGNGGYSVVDARMTVNYNGKLSRKELKQMENDQYTAVATRLKKEGKI